MKQILIILLVIISLCGVAQEFADKRYYLIDSLILEEVPTHDLQLIDSSLSIYHSSEVDTVRLSALGLICEGIRHLSWQKYQLVHYELLNQVLKKHHDEATTRKLKKLLGGALNNMGYIYDDRGDFDKSMQFYTEAVELAQEIDDGYGLSVAYNNLAQMFNASGDIDKALEYLKKSLKIQRELNDLPGMARSLNGIGYLYSNSGDMITALDYTNQSLEIEEGIGNKEGMAMCLNNLAWMYRTQDDYENALVYYKRSLELKMEVGNQLWIATSLNNIGFVYDKMGDKNSALEYYNNALEIREENHHLQGIAESLINISLLLVDQNNLDEALINLKRSLELQKQTNNQLGISRSLTHMGNVMLMQQQDIEAIKSEVLPISEEAISIAQQIGSPEHLSHSAKLQSDVCKITGNYKEALEMYELHIQMRDSLKNEENQKAAIRQQTKYEFEKAQLVREQEEKEVARLQQEETNRRNNLQYSLIFLGILLFFGGVLSLGYIKVSPSVAEGLIFFAFLILFEFLLVLADPYVESYTGGEPIYKLLANAILAGAIFPAHAFFEKALKRRLVKSN